MAKIGPMQSTSSNFPGANFSVTVPTPKQKVYRVIDDAICVLTTTDELKALRLLRKLYEKHDLTWAWVDEETLVA